jgi:hypothetical protein
MKSDRRNTLVQDYLQKCNDTIAQTKIERTVLHCLLDQAYVDKATIWIAAIRQKLRDHRIKLNRLTAQRHFLRRKLEAESLQAS